jgi:hypothetical protein
MPKPPRSETELSGGRDPARCRLDLRQGGNRLYGATTYGGTYIGVVFEITPQVSLFPPQALFTKVGSSMWRRRLGLLVAAKPQPMSLGVIR